MARPRVSNEMTTTIVARELGMGIRQLKHWIEGGVLPPPSWTDANGVRYFSDEWLAEAKKIVDRRRGGDED